ncbi:hypothetical protein F511_47363 [Dorcoceras hygrometricum]|uniref:Uncharacterized protein n=1 Tax=Dorcoceras hygrometricum TaxID=472368 RepID=A0A2Z6ZR83_9LAMI|nr:hypothetical protein F511_47363 [Dorcoceras hygrometricum]
MRRSTPPACCARWPMMSAALARRHSTLAEDVARRWLGEARWPRCLRDDGTLMRRLGRRTLHARRATSCALPPRVLRGGGAAAGLPPLRRCSGDVVTAGLNSSRV